MTARVLPGLVVLEATPANSHPAATLRRYPAVAECGNSAAPGAPCTRTECRYHLAHRGYWEHHVTPTRDCSLDVANEGPHSLCEIADILGVSAERVRQIEEQAIAHLKGSAVLRRLNDELSE